MTGAATAWVVAGPPGAGKSMVAATNAPYIVSLSRSAGLGVSAARRRPATMLFPAPGGPATTHAVAGPVMATDST